MASHKCRPPCPFCGSATCYGDCPHAWQPCWHCGGFGRFDDADDDGVNYAPGEEVTDCHKCDGEGGWYR